MFLIKIILVIVGLVYLFRLIAPYFLRYLITKLIRNISDPQENYPQEKKEDKNNPSKTFGEYIDYEEID